MCHKCVELDEKIARCQRLLAFVTDQLTITAISGLLESYLAERKRLHSEAAE